MFCTKCGNRLSENSAFCGKCGTPVQGSVSTGLAAPDELDDTSVHEESSASAPSTAPEASPAPAPAMAASSAAAEHPVPDEAGRQDPAPAQAQASSTPAPNGSVGSATGLVVEDMPPEPTPPAAGRPAASSAAKPRSSSGSSKKIAIAAIVIAIICVVAIIAMIAMSNAGNSGSPKSSDASETRVGVITRIDGEGYDGDAGTPIPVQIEGTSSNGNRISEVQYVKGDGTGIKLPSGSYELSFPASPINGDGALYAMPDAPVAIEVNTAGGTGKTDSGTQSGQAGSAGGPAGSGGVQDGSGTSQGGGGTSQGDTQTGQETQNIVPTIKLTPIDPADTTDEQIQKAEEYAKGSGEPDEKVSELVNKTKQTRSNAIKQREAAEQAQREAEEQARKEAEEQARREAEEQARREEEERLARESLPAGNYSYVAQTGGLRAGLTVNGDGTATMTYAYAMRPGTSETVYQLENTGSTASNGNPIFNMIPISGEDTTTQTVYYSPAQNALIVSDSMTFVAV